MRWPFRFKLRGAQAPAASSSLPPAAPGLLPSRPATGLEYLSDLTSDPKKALLFVFIFGSLIVISAASFAGVIFVIMEAAKQLRGVPVSATVSVGIGGASLLTLLSALIARVLRNLSKGGR